MSLITQLAMKQLKNSRKRTIWTFIGIILSTSMITAIYGFAASGIAAIVELWGSDNFMRQTYSTMFIGMGTVLSAIVMAASVIVVSNAFRISAGERIQQFGILKSVGATKKQIAQIVMYEGILLSLIGIPVGIVFGLFVQFIGLQIAYFILADLNRINYELLVFPFVVAWQAILVSVVIAFITVLLSAWLPARKAAVIASVDAIRGASEVKLKAKQIRSSRFVEKLFGFEGTLAYKSLKRNRRNLRATVVSITISIIMFIAASSFGAQMSHSTNLRFMGSDANIFGSFHSNIFFDPDTDERKFDPIDNSIADSVTARLREFPDTTVFGVGQDIHSFSANVPVELLTPRMQNHLRLQYYTEEVSLPVTIIILDEENYRLLCRQAGVPYGSNILINYLRTRPFGDDRLVEFAPHIWENQVLYMRNMLDMSDDSITILPLHGELRSIPGDLQWASGHSILSVVVPYASVHSYIWLANSTDPMGFEQYIFATFDEVLAPIIQEFEFHANTNVINAASESAAMQSLVNLIMVFIYGFVGMLTLIGLTNIISTISTNIRSRSREFAVLQSVGMTHSGLNRMLNLESILCSAKSLVIGLPLGIVASLLIYRAIGISFGYAYSFPWFAVVQCIIAVFVITWVTMRFSASRLQGGNIVETIRGVRS